MADQPYSFFDSGAAQPYAQPFGSHFQQPGFSQGNPANQGFAPAGGLNSGNAILDLIINGIVRGLSGGPGLGASRTFSRPGVSDYSSVMMRGREKFAGEAMGGVLSGNAQLGTFGELGKNRLFQQFVDQFASGGSLGTSFKSIYGRFGSTLAGPGISSLADAGRQSAQLLSNLDRGFTNQNGTWQYNKTSGMNRLETIQSLDAYSRRFGGDQIVRDLAAEPNASNKSRIDAAQGKISGITEMVREAQNLFGPDKGFEELMDEVDSMIDGARGMTTSKVRDTMQRIQAVGVVVDMNNEAMIRYMKVMDGMYKGMGYRGNNTATLSMNALIAGKAIEDDRKSKAEAKGEMYTGPNAQELAQSVGEVQMRVGQSAEMMKVRLATNVLANSGGNPELLSGINSKMANGDFAGANQMIDAAIKNGTINAGDAANILQAAGAAEERGGLSSTEEAQHRNYVDSLPDEIKKGINENLDSPLAALKTFENSFLAQMEDNGTREVAQRILGDRAGEFSQYMRQSMSVSDIKDQGKLKQKLMAQFGITEKQAGQLANQMNRDFEQVNAMKGPGSEAAISASWMTSEQEASYKANLDNVNRVQGEFANVLGDASFMRDLNIGEESLAAVTEAYKTLSGGGKRDISAKDIKEYFKATGQKFLGNEEYVQALMDMSPDAGGTGGMQKRLAEIRDQSATEADERAKGMGLDLSTQKGKEAAMAIKENIIKEKISGLQKEFGLDGSESGAPGDDKESDSKDDLNKIIKAIEDVAAAIKDGKLEISSMRGNGGPSRPVENSVIRR